jgi:heptosyltransferase-2
VNLDVFLPNWVGDVAMATPALRALRKQFPGARIRGVLRPYVAEVLAGLTLLDERLLYDPKARSAAHGAWGLVRALRRRRSDLTVLLTNSLRTAALAWAGGTRRRVGYAIHGRSWLLTDPVSAPHDAQRRLALPALDAYLGLAYHLGCPEESPRLELATSAEDERAADDLAARLGWRHGERLVVLNPGGAFGPAKLWPAEYFAELARRLVDQRRCTVLVHCGPNERDIARRIQSLAARPEVNSLADERLSLGLSKALVRRSRLLVTTDSGVRFFAAAFGVPVVSLFGPTDASWSAIYYPKEVCLQKPVPCGPCRQRTCPLEHHRCLRELAPDEVWQACRGLLDREVEQAA